MDNVSLWQSEKVGLIGRDKLLSQKILPRINSHDKRFLIKGDAGTGKTAILEWAQANTPGKSILIRGSATYAQIVKDIVTEWELDAEGTKLTDYEKAILNESGHTIYVDVSRKDGSLVQSSWKRMTTGVIAGRRNFGKSSILKSLVMIALHARKQGLKCKIHLFDPHHNLPDATGTFFKPILNQFDQCYLGLESLKDGKHLTLFRELLEMVQNFQEEGFDESAPWHFMFMDEADLFMQDKEYGKATYNAIRDLVNLRKGRIFFLMSFADTTKAGSGNIGTGLVAAGTSVFCVNYDIDRAKRILQGQGEAQRALNLPIGFAVVKIPDERRVTVCRMPYVTETDLQPFLQPTTQIHEQVTQNQTPEEPEQIILQDGEIIAKQQITEWDRIFGGFTYKHTSGFQIYTPKSSISPEQIEDELQHLAEFDEPETGNFTATETPAKVLPIKENQVEIVSSERTILSGYLTNNDQADFDAFLTYLEPKLSKRTIGDYGQNLKLWRKLLNGDLAPDNILKSLESFDYARAIHMRTGLFTYGQYRLTLNDPMIATNLAKTQYDPQPPADEKDKKIISEKEAEMYHTAAQKLCEEGKRAGIWIELCLLGVKPGQIASITILNKSTIQDDKKKIKIPEWLQTAIATIPEKQWRLNRKTIHKEVAQYETSPSLLNTATRYRSGLDSLREL